MVVYNLNHLGFGDADRRAAKLRTVRNLLSQHPIVGLQELHATSELEANALFFDHLDAKAFYDESLNLAILADNTWLDEHFATHNVQITHTQVVPGAIHAISWRSVMGTCYFFNLYLDASADPRIKIDQLQRGRDWATENIDEHTLCFAGGDRNHIRTPDERMAHDGAAGRPIQSVLRAWDAFMASLNFCSILPQPNFTFTRRHGDTAVFSVLDVIATNLDDVAEPLYQATTQCLELTGSEALDHSPVSLRWVHKPRRRQRSARHHGASSEIGAQAVRRPLPLWLLADPTFTHFLDQQVQAWITRRASGGLGLSEFVDLVYEVGTEYLRGHLIEAVTDTHRIQVTTRALQHLDTFADYRVHHASVERWCTIYPALRDLIMVVVDISTPGCCYSDHDSTARVREHLRILLAEQAETAKDPKGASETGSFLTQKMQSDLFRQLKQLRPRAQNHDCTSLWDPDTGQYCEDFDSMIRIIKDAALHRQGTDRSDPSVGDEFLRGWGVDMSNCRTEIASCRDYRVNLSCT